MRWFIVLKSPHPCQICWQTLTTSSWHRVKCILLTALFCPTESIWFSLNIIFNKMLSYSNTDSLLHRASHSYKLKYTILSLVCKAFYNWASINFSHIWAIHSHKRSFYSCWTCISVISLVTSAPGKQFQGKLLSKMFYSPILSPYHRLCFLKYMHILSFHSDTILSQRDLTFL